MDESESVSFEAKTDDSEKGVEFQQLSENIRSFVAPSILSEKWNFLGGHDNLLRIDMLPTEFVAAMELDYTVEELAELGLYERVDDELRLASWLEVDGNLYVAIDESNRTIAFSGGNDFLFPMNHTALDYAVERIPPDSTQAPATLFVVESQDAVEVMQRLGLPAVCSQGLNTLDGEGVSRLFRGDLQSDFGWRYYLLLLDFDVACLENRPQAAVHDVINRLADAQEVYGVDPSRRFGVCRPTESEFQLLERTTGFRDATQIREVFENLSTATKSVTIGSWRSHFALGIPSFSAARAELTNALQHSSKFHREVAVRVALPAYRAAGQGVLMQKFYDGIDRANDPFDQFDMIAAAAYAEDFFDTDPLVRAAEAVLVGKIPLSTRELREESLDQRQRCMVEFRRIRRDLKGKR